MKHFYKKTNYILAMTVGLMFAAGTNAQNINAYAGNNVLGFSGDGGAATAAELDGTFDVALDAAGNLYLADFNNNRIRKVTASTGVISTIAGTGSTTSSGDGAAATAAGIDGPVAIALDASGNIYIAEQHAARVRKITVSTGIITTVAGTGTAGFFGDGSAATAAEISSPSGVVIDNSGNIYIADGGNNRIRKVTVSTGIITTVAGTGTAGALGDWGLATAAEVNQPYGLSMDASGNIYIADLGNSKIRKINVSTGIISTVAGNGTGGYNSDGIIDTTAELNFPSGVAVDAMGNVYIGDENNNRVRMVDAYSHLIYTLAGTGVYGFLGDGGPATSAEFKSPAGLKADNKGNLFIADFSNNEVREISGIVGINELIAAAKMSVYPNPASQTLYISFAISGASTPAIVKVMDITGKEIMNSNTTINNGSLLSLDISSLTAGMYFIQVITEKATQVEKFIKR